MAKLRMERVEDQLVEPNEIAELARQGLITLLTPTKTSDRFIIGEELQKQIDELIREYERNPRQHQVATTV